MNRRHFLQTIGAVAAVTAAGIELVQLAVPKRTFFLPPVIGWLASRVLTLNDGQLDFSRDHKLLYGRGQLPVLVARDIARIVVAGTIPIEELAGLDTLRTVRFAGLMSACRLEGEFMLRHYELSSIDHGRARIELVSTGGVSVGRDGIGSA